MKNEHWLMELVEKMQRDGVVNIRIERATLRVLVCGETPQGRMVIVPVGDIRKIGSREQQEARLELWVGQYRHWLEWVFITQRKNEKGNSDKDLSKPMGYANKFSLEYAQRSGCEFAVYASDDVQGYDVPVYSDEYVQSLLGLIAELELDRDVWQASALALRDTTRGEYRRGYAEAMSSAASGVRQLYIQHTHHVGVDGLLNRCNELEQSFIQSEESHR